jgi:hypothetical protein
MRRLLLAVVPAAMILCHTGCGDESQPNAPTAPEQVNADFGKSTGDMMKAANSGMDKKKK